MDVSVVFINRGVLSIYFLHHPSEHPNGELEEHSGKLTLGAHAQRGYCTWSVCLFVCLFVCLSVYDYSRTTGYEAVYERASVLQGQEKWCGDFAKTTAFDRERYGVKTSGKANMHNEHWPRPGLSRSAHRGRINSPRGYVPKSSAALNPLTITQLASYSLWAEHPYPWEPIN